MNKVQKISSFIGALLIIGTLSVFGAVQVTESDLIVSDNYAVSYQVQPTDQVLSFLSDNGIDVYGVSSDVSLDIDLLRTIDFDTDDGYAFNDSWTTEKDELNYLVKRGAF